jgi:sulfhydrogenase subunit beta (sulfur reductase)
MGLTAGMPDPVHSRRYGLTLDGLAKLLRGLTADGYTLIGPTVRDGAIVHAEISGLDDLPIGFADAQEVGTYRLVRRSDARDALFGYSVGPQSYKQLFFVPRLRLFKIRRKDDSFRASSELCVSVPVARPRRHRRGRLRSGRNGDA